MEELYLGWIEQLDRALSRWGSVRIDVKPRLVVVTGMGGSGCVGDYVQALAHDRVPVIVSKTYRLPGFVGRGDLVFTVSYSGNTLETISAYKQAIKRGASIVVITSNGFLAKDATAHGIPVVTVVKGIAPRTALPEMLYGILGVLDASGIPVVPRKDAEKARDFIKEHVKEAIDIAYEIAARIHKNRGNLIIATHSPYEVLAIRGKNEFNENAKIPVKAEITPEWAHNDIVGWEKPYDKNWQALVLRDPEDSAGSRLVEFMGEIYDEAGVSITYTLDLKGGSLLEKLLYGSLVLGLASVKLARLRGIDPLETRNIKKYKGLVKNMIKAEI